MGAVSSVISPSPVSTFFAGTQAIDAAESKTRLEDVYAPFRAKRTTKSAQARALGLGPLADAIRNRPASVPFDHAKDFVDGVRVPTAAAALEGMLCGTFTSVSVAE